MERPIDLTRETLDGSLHPAGVSEVEETLVGDEDAMFEGLNPRVNLEVRQKNRFYANRCDDDDAFQHASTRPSRNLFSVPGVGDGIDDLTSLSETESFAKARLQASLNVDPGELASDDFVDGEFLCRLFHNEPAESCPKTQMG